MAKRHNATGRSKGEARHIRLYHWLLASPAWCSLRPVPRAVYMDLAARYNGSNNGKIHYSVREGAADLHTSKSTIDRALDVLQQRGFIMPVKRGGFSLKIRHATEWRLTEFPCDVTRELPSKEFLRWSKIQNTVPVVGPKVPLVGQYGPSGGTVTPKKPPDGPSGGTVKAEKSISQSHRWDTYSLPGDDAAQAPVLDDDSHGTDASPASASAPPQGAVARARGPKAPLPVSDGKTYLRRGGRYG